MSQRTPEEILAALDECKARGLTVWLDNDHVGANDYSNGGDATVLAVHPDHLLQALLTHYGLAWEHV